MFDTCGTGGDRSGTFNISSCAALVVAACGVRVAKHGNRSVSSLSGSADVFEALGVKVTASPAVVERCLAEANIGFFFAPTFHPSMRHAGPARKALGVRTAFNLLGPLTNPAGATRQLVGVPRPEFTELMARALMLLGSERAWVVHGADGIDEISTTGYTKISECANGAVKTFYLHPADVGLPKAAAGSLAAAMRPANARIIVRVLDGEHGPARDVVLLNAGAALFIAGQGGFGSGRHRSARRRRSIAARRDGRSSGSSRCRSPRNRWRERAHDGTGRSVGGSAGDDRRGDEDGSSRSARSGSRLTRWRGGRSRDRPSGAFRSALSRTDRVNIIAECKRRSPSRGVLRADYDPVAIARSLRSRRRGGDFGADRADLLRRRARASERGARGGGHAAAAEGLHRLRVSAARGAGGRRRCGPADRRGADARGACSGC